MTRVFISYSRRDKLVADYLATELRNRGAEVFIDYQQLLGGENFIGRLGREIEACDHLVLIISPRSVVSKWVQAEIAWALNCDKRVVPLILEPASMVDFFFLVNVERVDFTRWSLDGEVGEAVLKLARALNLPEQPYFNLPAQTLPGQMPDEDEDENGSDHAVTFARSELSEIFLTAAEIASRDPERAIFLYRQVLKIDPDYGRGQVHSFVEREEARLKPLRLANMLQQAELAMKRSDWKQAEHIGRDMLALDASNADAQWVISICEKNSQCEPVYEHAVIAAQRGRWGAVATLLNDVKTTCPDYGDPAGLSRIRLEAVDWVRERATLKGHNASVNAVAFAPDGKRLASASADATIILWEVATQRPLLTLHGHSGAVNAITFSHDGQWLASGSDDRTIQFWEVMSGKQVTAIRNGHSHAINTIAFSPNDKLLASGSGDKTVRLWDLTTFKEVLTLPGYASWVFALAFSPDGSLLASGSGDPCVKIWDTRSWQEYATLTRHSSLVQTVCFMPDGKRLASGAWDNWIKLWELESGEEIGTFAGHLSSVLALDFSPDGTLLASGSDDHSVRLWNSETGAAVNSLNSHSSAVTSVRFSPDGGWLASASQDMTVKLWSFG